MLLIFKFMLISLEIVVLIYWFYSASLHILFLETAVVLVRLQGHRRQVLKGLPKDK